MTFLDLILTLIFISIFVKHLLNYDNISTLNTGELFLVSLLRHTCGLQRWLGDVEYTITSLNILVDYKKLNSIVY